jgi:hypothetical protein
VSSGVERQHYNVTQVSAGPLREASSEALAEAA